MRTLYDRCSTKRPKNSNKEWEFILVDRLWYNDADGMGKEYTIAMYFPTGVKDSVSVDYEAKDVGLSDIALDKYLIMVNVLVNYLAWVMISMRNPFKTRIN